MKIIINVLTNKFRAFGLAGLLYTYNVKLLLFVCTEMFIFPLQMELIHILFIRFICPLFIYWFRAIYFCVIGYTIEGIYLGFIRRWTVSLCPFPGLQNTSPQLDRGRNDLSHTSIENDFIDIICLNFTTNSDKFTISKLKWFYNLWITRLCRRVRPMSLIHMQHILGSSKM